jgi:hypothetical protein
LKICHLATLKVPSTKFGFRHHSNASKMRQKHPKRCQASLTFLVENLASQVMQK